MNDVNRDTRSAVSVGSAAARAGERSFLVGAVFGNLALLSGIVTMPIVIAVGYLVRGHG